MKDVRQRERGSLSSGIYISATIPLSEIQRESGNEFVAHCVLGSF